MATTAEPSTTATSATSTTSTTSTSAPPTTAAPQDGWERVVPGGDCQCADGSEYSYWVRDGDPERVLFFLQGGGACFSVDTCRFVGGAYKTSTGPDDDPAKMEGIFDLADPRNPLADFSMLYVPYCTGDLHLGDSSTVYGDDLTVEHKGFVNASAALDQLVADFPDAQEIVVAGESAGAAPAPLFGGLLADRLPEASVAVLADGAGAYPDVPAINALVGQLWGTAASIPDWPSARGLPIEEWSLPGLYVQAGTHVGARLVLARHDYAYDRVQTTFGALAGFDASNLLQLIDDNEAAIEAGGVDLRSYIAPGSDHTVLSSSDFYDEEVEGVALVDWVTALVDGEADGDVHCTTCSD